MALLMAIGGGLALSDRRYALAARKQREAIEGAKVSPTVPLAPAPAKLQTEN
jgi:hypothetical protein